MSIKNTKRICLAAKSLLSALMLFSAGMYIFTPQPEVFLKLGYPGYLLYILAVAKILGVISLWIGRLKYIRQWAYAGFFYDVVLAFTAHVYIKDGEWQPALAGTIFILAAVLSEKKLEKHS